MRIRREEAFFNEKDAKAIVAGATQEDQILATEVTRSCCGNKQLDERGSVFLPFQSLWRDFSRAKPQRAEAEEGEPQVRTTATSQ